MVGPKTAGPDCLHPVSQDRDFFYVGGELDRLFWGHRNGKDVHMSTSGTGSPWM